MVPYFPRRVASNAIITYLISLAIVSVVFFRYLMLWGYIVPDGKVEPGMEESI